MKKIFIVIAFFSVSCAETSMVDKTQAIISIAASPATIDIQKSTDTISRSVFVHVYDGLLTFDTNGNIIPALALSWTNITPRMIEFTIRTNVMFHNGETMTVSDVVASLNRVRMVPESQTQYEKIESVEAVGNNKIRIYLKSPFPSMIGYMAHPKASIYPKSLIDKIGTNTVTEPIGTGPYSVKNYTHGDLVQLTAHTNYWNGVPAIKNLTFKVVVDEIVRTISLENGDIQGSMDIPSSQISDIKLKENLEVYQFKGLGVDYLGFNMSSPRLQNKKLREAITKAIDKQGIIDAVYFGYSTPSDTLFDERMFGAYTDPDPLTYDLAGAKEIIQAEGLTGYKLQLLISEGYRVKIAEIIQATLREIGLEVEIRVLEWATYLEALRDDNHELFLLGWSNSAFDPDSSLYTVFHSSNIASGYNKSFYSNPQFDQLVESAAIETNIEKRRQLYIDAQKIIREDRAAVFLLARVYHLVFSSDLEGIELIPTGDHKLHRMRYKSN